MPDVQLYFHKTAASLHDNSALIFYKYDYGANAQFLCSKKEKSTELKGSVLVLDFEDRSGVDEYLSNEPYVTNKVWEKIEVEPINVVILNGKKVGK